jgi:hypothetical protein
MELVKEERPDKERYSGPPGWELGRKASTLTLLVILAGKCRTVQMDDNFGNGK